MAPRRPVRLLPLLLAAALAAPAARAQVSETPFTVAPGHFRLELDGVRLSLQRPADDGAFVDALAVGSTQLTAGLTATVDLQVRADLFLRQAVSGRGRGDADAGWGDVSLRSKWTCWRSDSGNAALALIPYLRLPTASAGLGSERIDGGLILPWAQQGPAGLVSGASLQWDRATVAGGGTRQRWLGTAFLRRDLGRLLSLYAEATFGAQEARWSRRAGTAGAGVLLRAWGPLELDYQLERGLNRSAPEWIHTLRLNRDW